MEWSKLKNVMLLMLVGVNIILLMLVGAQERRADRYQEETRQAAQAVLEQSGISFLVEEFPEDLALPVLTVTRDRDSEAAVAEALLGEATLQNESEVRPRYTGPGGTAEFSMNGTFTATLLPGRWTRTGGQDLEAACRPCLDAIGFTGTLTGMESSGTATAVTYCQLWEGMPLFSSSLTLYWEGDELVRIEGQRLSGTADSAAEKDLLSTPTLLVRFLEGINQGGYVCSRIDSMTSGYLTKGTARQVQLTPVWRFVTDTGTYYVDALTGEFTPLG
nr:hypothetical protein [uncultured Flavonifractor sp.]